MAGGEPEEIAIRLVSASYFRTLGVHRDGRPHLRRRGRAGRRLAPYAVISHEFWQRRFGGRADAIGATIALADRPRSR